LKNNFHVLRQNTKLNVQDNFVFVDVESNINQVEEDKQILTFKMCCAIFWKKSLDLVIKEAYYIKENFWDDLEYFFQKIKLKDNSPHLIMLAHNMEFDFRQLDGYRELFTRGWKLTGHYIKQGVFIFNFEKDKFHLHIWSTTNYVKKPLSAIGKTLNLPKLEIDFKKDSDEYLEVYCMRDTEIIYVFIREMIEFLEKEDLSKLKATAGSLSLNIFRHKFYNSEKRPIFIHDWKKAILLERNSYRGGITDCFQLGEKLNTYKLDINSMYPKTMEDSFLPYKLDCWLTHKHKNQEQLFSYYNKYKRTHGIIAKVLINIPEEYAYIISDFGLGKSSFCYGDNLEITLCSPELNFIEKYGKIVKILEIAIYQTRRIFRQFVKYFYKLRMEYKKIGNSIYVEFCKLILNTLYGKFGQKETISKMLDKTDTEIIIHSDIIMLMIEKKKEVLGLTSKDFENNVIYLGTIIDLCEIYLINKKLYIIQQTSNNSENSFVAISSFITSYSRMMLIDYILKAKRENVYYSDTDSLFVNKIGYKNLLSDINEFKLGKLKVEEEGSCEIYAPKFYDFNGNRKVKGIKQKNSILLEETDKRVLYQVEQWQRAKSALKENNYQEQIIAKVKKQARKYYDKGNIDKYGIISPFSIEQIKSIT